MSSDVNRMKDGMNRFQKTKEHGNLENAQTCSGGKLVKSPIGFGVGSEIDTANISAMHAVGQAETESPEFKKSKIRFEHPMDMTEESVQKCSNKIKEEQEQRKAFEKRTYWHWGQREGTLGARRDMSRDCAEYEDVVTEDSLLNELNGIDVLEDLDMVLSQEWTNIPAVLMTENPSYRYWIYNPEFEHLFSVVVSSAKPTWINKLNRLVCRGLPPLSFRIVVLNVESRDTIEVDYSNKTRDKIPILGRVEVLGYLQVKRSSKTIEIKILNKHGAGILNVVGSTKDWNKEVKIYEEIRTRSPAPKPHRPTIRPSIRPLMRPSYFYAEQDMIGNMNKIKGGTQYADVSQISGWGSRMKIDTETITVTFPPSLPAQMKASVIAAMFVLDRIKRNRHTKLTKL